MTALACVTGATGIVGRKVVSLLLEQGIRVRILTRNLRYIDSSVEVVYGDLNDSSAVENLLNNADCLFHCAAELNDEARMWKTNAIGTQRLLQIAANHRLSYICHLSSVGVIGKLSAAEANETSPCAPMNAYEKSKLKAEKVAMQFQGNGRVIILRPTNVVSKEVNSLSGLSKLAVFIKGGENAHIVHADDVAAAALYFLNHPSKSNPDCFIVSCDQEKMNTVAGCLSICEAIRQGASVENVSPRIHLPWLIPYFLRRLFRGPCNRGDLRYSPEKLLSTGFKFSRGFIGALEDICEHA